MSCDLAMVDLETADLLRPVKESKNSQTGNFTTVQCRRTHLKTRYKEETQTCIQCNNRALRIPKDLFPGFQLFVESRFNRVNRALSVICSIVAVQEV